MDAGVLKIVVLVLFIITYVMLLIFSKYRSYIALAAAAIFVIIGALPVNQIITAVNWNVLLMIVGTMGTVYLFIESKMPARLADMIIEKTPNVKWTIVALSLFAGVISAFVDNVATVLMVAPVALDIAKKLKISPVPSIISISIASNLEGAATLVGDTTSILLGGHANMTFLDFFFFQGKIGLFWIVQVGMIAALLVLLFIFRRDVQPVHVEERTEVTDYFPSALLLGTVGLLILASFLPNMPALINGYICVGLFVIGLIRQIIKSRKFSVLRQSAAEIDFHTLLLLLGLFVVIGGLGSVGIIDDISKFFVSISDKPFVIFTLIVWASVLLSAFIDNIPYVATMLPVVTSIAAQMGVEPYLFYFGLLVGATLGGNLTPIGASANITSIGILRKAGYDVKASQFMKISVPFTLVAVITGYLLVWFIWS